MSKSVVRIIESACIGCTKCVPVCPVDAIMGAAQQLHAVLSEYCIGCNLCIRACPVNCIEQVPRNDVIDNKVLAKAAKIRVKARKARLARIGAKEQAQREKISSQLDNELNASLIRVKQKKKPLLWS